MAKGSSTTSSASASNGSKRLAAKKASAAAAAAATTHSSSARHQGATQDAGSDEDEDDEDGNSFNNTNGAVDGHQNGTNSNEPVWVQCNTCDKWRSLPPSVNPAELPDIWTCDLNVYDPDRNSCTAPEENYLQGESEKDLPLKGFLRLWTKKLKNAERAESRLASPAMTRNRKRKLDVEYIKCCNPNCGKWRAISRGIESSFLLKRLNKNRKFGEGILWFCSMNSWDDTTASCAAPQEPLWNARWNLST